MSSGSWPPFLLGRNGLISVYSISPMIKIEENPHTTKQLCWTLCNFSGVRYVSRNYELVTHEKKIGHRDCSRWAHGEFTVSSRWPRWSQPVVTEPWPGPWLSCDLAVTEPWSPWLNCDWAVTELWPSRDWAVTELWPSLAVIEPWSLAQVWGTTLPS